MLLPSLNARFLHIPKTGGCSIEESLAEYSDYNVLALYLRKVEGEEYLVNHQHALPEEVSRCKFTFSFVRNPWDRVVSYYFHVKRLGLLKQDVSFQQMMDAWPNLQDIVPPRSMTDTFMLPCKRWAGSADFVGKFERINLDFARICLLLDIPMRGLLHVNKTEHSHYSKYYNELSMNMIGEFYKDDVLAYDYSFEVQGG